MKKTIKLLKKLGLGRARKVEEESPFDKRLKKVNRMRLVNNASLGGPVLRSRSEETET